MTNGERIRAKSDDELAKMLVFLTTQTCGDCDNCTQSNENELCRGHAHCTECVLAWLRQEADA